MKRLIFFALILTIAFWSCKKEAYEFEHSDEYMTVPCNCCKYKQYYEGQYIGTHLYRVKYFMVGGGGPVMDTIYYGPDTLNVTFIQTQQDFITDSTICALFVDGFINDTIFFTDSTGSNFPKYFDYQNFYLYNGSFLISDYDQFPDLFNTTYLKREFYGFK